MNPQYSYDLSVGVQVDVAKLQTDLRQTLKAKDGEIESLRQQLELYKAENAGLREAGFENGQDLLTSYLGMKQQLAAKDVEIEQVTAQKNAMWFAMEKQAATNRQLKEAIKHWLDSSLAEPSLSLCIRHSEQALALPDDGNTTLRKFTAKIIESFIHSPNLSGLNNAKFISPEDVMAALQRHTVAIRSGEIKLPK